jgi:sulfite reductase beta subunit-like hemoprotein
MSVEQPFLPRFSNPKDIESFVEKLEAFERGEMGPDQFRAFRLLRGVYGQRQDDVQMIRVKLPFGLLGASQLDVLADIADKYAPAGIGHVTTRQNVQFHFVKLSDAEAVMHCLDAVGITTRDACGNSVRTVTACEVAEVCGDAAFDVSPYAEAMTRYFLGHPLSGGLPRKFKIAFSGCESDCASAAINDLGFVALARDGQPGFKVFAAGGLSTSPQAAIVLHDFIPAAEIGRVGEAILRLFDSLGNRENKHRARLKYVLRKLGEPKFREAYEKLRADVDAEAKGALKMPDAPARKPPGALADAGAAGAKRSPGYLAWRASSVTEQRDDGYAAVYVRLFLGDMTSTVMRALGRIATRFGDGTVRLTIDQNLLLPWIHKDNLPALHAELDVLGLAKLDIHTARDVLSCPGASSCNLAVTASRSLGSAITARLDDADATGLAAIAGTSIKISGCPHSCGQHHVADIGFHGAARTVPGSGVTVPVYQLHLGGGVDEKGARFGRQVVKIIARRVPDAVVLLMKLYESDRNEGEAASAFFLRVDPKRVTAALASVLGGPEPGDTTDIGETVGFVVDTKDGECAA